jgi:putative flippase GtrA
VRRGISGGATGGIRTAWGLFRWLRRFPRATILLRFALVGAINTGVYWVSYLLLNLALAYAAAHVLAFVVGTMGSFFLNCRFTYRVTPTLKRLVRFPLTTLANFVCTTVGLLVLVDLMRVDERVAPLLASAAAIPVT